MASGPFSTIPPLALVVSLNKSFPPFNKGVSTDVANVPFGTVNVLLFGLKVKTLASVYKSTLPVFADAKGI
jgi:hypothetical protein